MTETDTARRRDQDAAVVVIVERLHAGGATEIRAATDVAWLVARAPSGALVELYWWPDYGYFVNRCATATEALRRLGNFLTWEDAVGCALQA
jgi:hypothetical protein